MDEPTSAISRSEVDALFQVIRDLKRQGVAVIYISHRMDEVFRIADTVTILRDGCYVATHAIGKLDPGHLIALMVGRELTALSPCPSADSASVALKVRGLTGDGKFADVNFELRCGEVLGIAGLMGAGRTELANALFGLAPADHGEIQIHGRKVRIGSPQDAIANGVALVSEDRNEYGLVAQMSVKQNLTLSSLRKYCRAFWINRREENRVVDDCISTFAVRTPSRNQKAAYLSGGNQQKVVMAKALLSEPDILILDDLLGALTSGRRSRFIRSSQTWREQAKQSL
jgi:inositol transport system ATP-binding protein